MNKKRRFLVVGAGPVGSAMALRLREKYPSVAEVEIELFDKRLAPGNRDEMLFINENAWETFSPHLKESLIEAKNEDIPKAFYSSNTFHQFRNPFKMLTNDPHLTVTITNLELALHEEIRNQNIVFHQGVKFIKNYKEGNDYYAVFENVSTQQLLVKKYDEIILALGLSGVLKQDQFAAPRFLHGFQTVAALYKMDFQKFDSSNHPTQVTYLAGLNSFAGVTITPNCISVSISVPRNVDHEIKENQIKYLQKAIDTVPKSCQHLVKNLGEPTAFRAINASTSLAPILTYDSLHSHPIGDMLLTFPYVFGSETNFAMTDCIPLLINHLDLIVCDPENRLRYSAEYCAQLKKLIFNHKCFYMMLPFCDAIQLGSLKSKICSMFGYYYFPGWEALSKAEPIVSVVPVLKPSE